MDILHKGYVRKGTVILMLAGIVALSGCHSKKVEEFIGESVDVENEAFFPAPADSFVGDPMPFYDGEHFQVFFLDDLRDGRSGYHPWSLYTTDDLYHYSYTKEVIPFGATSNEQDIALGTGSVIRGDDGLYHAFYTGHNDVVRPDRPKEAVMHAVSRDLKTWEKRPGDTFDGRGTYSGDDFRDPYVLYVEEAKEYWMLVTTRKDQRGIIAKYTSRDLQSWTDAGVFFENDMGTDSNLECPSLLSYGGKWYLFFSDQWPDRVVHYRVSDRVNGTFEKPERDCFDGNGFYAGRAESDGENMYLFGWNGTKEGYADGADYAWGGNLVVHQLCQNDTGELDVEPVGEMEEELTRRVPVAAMDKTDGVRQKKDQYEFSGGADECAVLGKLRGNYRIEGTIRLNGETTEETAFGFSFGDTQPELSYKDDLQLVFEPTAGRLSFYNAGRPDGVPGDASPQSSVKCGVLETDRDIPFTMLISDTVVSLYVDHTRVLTTRMYGMQDGYWKLFGENAEMTCRLDVYK